MSTSATQPNITDSPVNANNIYITDAARDQINKLITENAPTPSSRLRVYIEGGGCSGFAYGFTLEEPTEEDILINHNDCQVIIDPISLEFMQGSTLDYKDTVTESYFTIKNPREKKSGCGCKASGCGCGTSGCGCGTSSC